MIRWAWPASHGIRCALYAHSAAQMNAHVSEAGIFWGRHRIIRYCPCQNVGTSAELSA